MSELTSVAFNLVFLVPKVGGGSERYARHLLPAVKEVRPDLRVSAYVNKDAAESLMSEPWADEVDWVRVPVRGLSRPWRLLAELAGVPAIAVRRRPSVVHSLGSIAPPILPGIANVVTLLDVIWMHHETMARISTLSMRLLGPMSARRADRVLTISNVARDDIVATLGLDQAKIDVAHLGIDLDESAVATPEPELRSRLGLPSGPLVLCVAAKKPHKNLVRLIEAFAAVKREPAPVLVLPGIRTAHEDELREAASRLGVADRIRFPEWLEETDLEGLYRAAVCFVLPSLMEGFGLPILEAMGRGVPVACSNVSALPEIAGDAALLFDPARTDEIRRAIERLLDDRPLAQGLIAAGRKRCAQFTWRATASATLACYQRALESRAPSRSSRRFAARRS